MGLTKIKRKELKRGDMFCAPYEKGVSEVYVVTLDGDDVIDSISNMEVFQIDVPRIGLPDYTHELTQFSWKLKALDDWTKECNVRIDEIEQKLHPHVDSEVAMHNVLKSAFGDLYRRVDEHNTIDERDERIEELETRLTGCRQAKESLQGIVETQLSKIEELESHEGMIIGNLRAINMRLHKTIDERDKRNEELETRLVECRQAKQSLQEIIDGQTSHIEEIENKNRELYKIVQREPNVVYISAIDPLLCR